MKNANMNAWSLNWICFGRFRDTYKPNGNANGNTQTMIAYDPNIAEQ